MIHLTNRNLQVRIGNQNFELLAVYYVSAISIMTFAKKTHDKYLQTFNYFHYSSSVCRIHHFSSLQRELDISSTTSNLHCLSIILNYDICS